jgi:hypothetical protein
VKTISIDNKMLKMLDEVSKKRKHELNPIYTKKALVEQFIKSIYKREIENERTKKLESG